MMADHTSGLAAPSDPGDLYILPAGTDVRRCWGCRKLRPRAAMRWGSVNEGPIWYPRVVRVLRCADCLA